MSYKGIQDLYNDLNTSVSNTDGLSSFYMLDESEANKLRDIIYPTCIASIPDSTVSDVNSAYEEYSMTVLILNNDSRLYSDTFSLKIYDDCMDLFSKLSDEILCQRGGRFIIDSDSIEIERVSRLGNDLATGIRVRFKLLAPSMLAYPPSETTVTYVNNLLGFYTTSKGKSVSTTSSSIDWSIEQGSLGSITHSFSSNIVEFTNNKFIFKEPNHAPNAEALQTSVNFSGADFTLIGTVFIDDNPPTEDNRTLFCVSDGVNDGELLALEIVSSQSSTDGRISIIQRKTGNAITSTNITNTDISPFGSADKLKSIAFVNNHTEGYFEVYLESNVPGAILRIAINGGKPEIFSNSKLIIGARPVIFSNHDGNAKGFEGHLKNVLVYDEAVSSNNLIKIFNELVRFP